MSDNAPCLIVGGKVHAKLYTLANDNGTGSSGQVLASEADYTVTSDAISVPLTGMAADSVAQIQLTPPAPSGPGGPSYYISWTSGNDSNPGTQAAPWQHLPGMQGTVLACLIHEGRDFVWEDS